MRRNVAAGATIILFCIVAVYGFAFFVDSVRWNNLPASRYDEIPVRKILVDRLFVSSDRRIYTIFEHDQRGLITHEDFLDGVGVRTAGAVRIVIDGDQTQNSYAEVFNGWRAPTQFHKEGSVSERQMVIVHLRDAKEISG